MSSYQMESCIHRFHIYKEVWTPFIGERLGCAREKSNREDPFAVAMKRGTETVGHVPRTISFICMLFLRQRVLQGAADRVSTYCQFSYA